VTSPVDAATRPEVRFTFLGPVQAWVDGVSVPLGGAKQKTVLAALLLCIGRTVSDEKLMRLVWDGNLPATASAQLYTYVSRLRTRLHPHVPIHRVSDGYVLDAEHAWLDHREFTRLIEEGTALSREGRCTDASDRLRSALDLWVDTALRDVTPYLRMASLPALEEARMAALEARIEVDLRLGHHARLVSELTALLADHPFRDTLRIHLMTALCRCGRAVDALAVYDAGRTLLSDELGLDPSAELVHAHHAVLTGSLGRSGNAAGPDPAGRVRMPGPVPRLRRPLPAAHLNPF